MNQNSATEVIEPVSSSIEGDGIKTDNNVNSHADNSSTESHADNSNKEGCNSSGKETGDCAKMTLFISKFIGRKSNVSYPYKAVITSLPPLFWDENEELPLVG